MGRPCKHGHHKNYESTGTWRSWSAMIARYKWRKGYKDRGICEDWIGERGFENFLSDMGERPDGMTIERVDNDKGYYPNNCIWASMQTQSNNRGNNHIIEYDGESMTLTEWARRYGLSSQTLRHRLYKQKMPMDEALTSPKLYGYNTRKIK